ncbi:hypothetical protein BC834DRAFT_276075 [Gloeopeniophorella convolvens]|nr:hypothetical protein BC834DRAFT_276075 [Gloeopeniophorella convolvens]
MKFFEDYLDEGREFKRKASAPAFNFMLQPPPSKWVPPFSTGDTPAWPPNFSPLSDSASLPRSGSPIFSPFPPVEPSLAPSGSPHSSDLTLLRPVLKATTKQPLSSSASSAGDSVYEDALEISEDMPVNPDPGAFSSDVELWRQEIDASAHTPLPFP